jgi:hypothetical protein
LAIRPLDRAVVPGVARYAANALATYSSCDGRRYGLALSLSSRNDGPSMRTVWQ